MQTVPFSTVISLFQAIKASTLLTLLFFLLNSHTFFKLSDKIKHIHNYLGSLEHVKLYCDLVKQTIAIFEIKSLFASNLIKAIKKDYSLRSEK